MRKGRLWGWRSLRSNSILINGQTRLFCVACARFPKTSTRLTNSVSFNLRKNQFGLNTITSLPHTQLSKGRGKLEIELKSTWRRCWRDLTRSSQKPASCVVVEPSPLRQIIVHWVRLKIQQWRPTRSHEADLLRQWMPIFWSIWAMLSEHSKTAWWWWWSPTSSSASQKILHFGQSNHPCHSSCCV